MTALFNRLCAMKHGYLMILVVGVGMAGFGMLVAEIARLFL